jgi:uncharacterized membrane protein YidH (DUF202 family)
VTNLYGGGKHPEVLRDDFGLQPERVELAWRRTFLALTAGICLGIRATDHEFGIFSVILGALAFALIAVGAGLHRKRARQQLVGFHGDNKLKLVDGLPIVLVGIAVIFMALFAVTWFVLRLLG